jgi:GNAT superfamily N-acetyltransferase
MQIRPMQIEDIDKMEELMAQLGYPASISILQERFKRLLHLPNYHTLIAETNGSVVGLVGMCRQDAYEFDEQYVRVLALVVHNDFRRQNIGQSLMRAVEEWARDNHCVAITLNSGNREERIAAHKFYECLGFLGKSTGFSKRLTEN